MILPLIMWEFANFTVSPMDSEWSKPCVYGALHIDTRLFCVACNNRQCPPKHACDEISMTPSPGISRLRDVLQLVVYASHGSLFPESRACRGHPSRPLYVASRFGDKLYATHRQALGNLLADMPFACDRFTACKSDKYIVFQWIIAISIIRNYHEVLQLALLVAGQIRLEAKEPSHGTFASLYNALKHFMDMCPLVPAFSQGSAVHGNPFHIDGALKNHY